MGNYRRVPDGAGEAVSLKFVMADPMEMRALEVAQDLATKHGRRKEYLMAFLLALADVRDSTGSYPTAYQLRKVISGES